VQLAGFRYECFRFSLDFVEDAAVSARRNNPDNEIPRPIASFSATSMEGLRIPRSISVRYVRWREARWASSSCVRCFCNRKRLIASPNFSFMCLCPSPTTESLNKIFCYPPTTRNVAVCLVNSAGRIVGGNSLIDVWRSLQRIPRKRKRSCSSVHPPVATLKQTTTLWVLNPA
jgi:hypothetical protein